MHEKRDVVGNAITKMAEATGQQVNAHELGQDALLAVLGGLVKLRREIPASSHRGIISVNLPVSQPAKLALDRALRAHGLNTFILAAKLNKGENETRRWLDLDHTTKIKTLESALAAVGRPITTEVHEVA